MPVTLFRWSLPALLCLCVTGCGTTVAQIAREAAPAAFSGGLAAANDPANRARAAEILASPEVRAAIRDLSRDLADGMLDTLAAPERQARIEALTGQYLHVVSREAARALRADLGPALADVTRQAVAAALREGLRAESRRAMQQAVAEFTTTATTAAGHALADSVRSEIGPALRDTFTRDLAPAMATALDDRTNRALGVTAHVVAREAVMGGNDALATIQRAADHGAARPSLLSRMSSLTDKGVRLANVVAAMGITATLALALWVVRLTVRSRRLQAESQRRAAAAVMVAEAIKATEGRPWSDDLRKFLRERFGSDPAAADLRELLKAPRPTDPDVSIPA